MDNPNPQAEQNNESSNGAVQHIKPLKREISWPMVLFYIHLNILGLYGAYILFTNTKLLTIVFCKFS